MNKTVTQNQKFFDLYLEYSTAVTTHEKEYRKLEGKFALAFGYLPIRLEDETFPHLTEKQQSACSAFWNNSKVNTARKALDTARILSQAYFDAYADRIAL